jgi:hypothetical protein
MGIEEPRYPGGLTGLLDGAAGQQAGPALRRRGPGLSRDLLAEIGRAQVMAGEPRSPARLSIPLVGYLGSEPFSPDGERGASPSVAAPGT